MIKFTIHTQDEYRSVHIDSDYYIFCDDDNRITKRVNNEIATSVWIEKTND